MRTNNMKKFVFIISLALLFGACERNADIDIPHKNPKLVVHGFLEKNEPIELRIGKSQHILTPRMMWNDLEKFTVKDATVVVYENNVPLTTLVYDPVTYSYKSPDSARIRDGYSYTVKVTAPGFSEAEALSVVPSQSAPAEVDITRDVRINSYGEHMDEVIIKFNDPAGEKNYYLIRVYPTPYGGWESQPVWCVSTTDKDLETIGDHADPLSTDNCYDGGSLLLRDDNFNGNQKLLRFYVNSYNMQENIDPVNGRTYRPYIKLYRITEDRFRYEKSYGVYYQSSGNPFAEPVNVFSNVKNGYGSFSAYTMAVDTLR